MVRIEKLLNTIMAFMVVAAWSTLPVYAAELEQRTHPSEGEARGIALRYEPNGPDCNGNAMPDSSDVATGTSPDCNVNGVPDECENPRCCYAALLVTVNGGGGHASYSAGGVTVEIASSMAQSGGVGPIGSTNYELLDGFWPAASGLPGCGMCELLGDIAPLPANKCLVDVDDLLCALDGFSGIPPCACLADIVASDFTCGPDGLNDVSDLFVVLDAFLGLGSCPAPCAPGACVGDFTDDSTGTTICRDGDSLGPCFAANGMSESDCFNLTSGGTGTYCGDNTVCNAACTACGP